MIKWIIILVIVFVFLYFGYVKLRKLEDGIEYTFSITSIKGDLSQVISYFGSANGKSNVDIGFAVALHNTSGVPIYLSGLKVQLYYEDNVVAVTPDDVKDNFVEIQGSGVSTYNGTVKIVVNPSTINLVTAITTGKTVNIKYTIHGKITKLGIPFVYSSVFSYKKQ